MTKPQDLKHHARLDPAFHFISTPLLVINLIVVIVHLVHQPSYWNGWLVALSVGLFVPVVLIRTYALKVQDRVIRLEERLRLQSLAGPESQREMLQLSEDQLVGLRFASDEEVVQLARQALAERLTRKQIKERIRSWRADHWRV